MIFVTPAPGLEFAVEEFFQLFRTPWRYWEPGETSTGPHDVLLATGSFPQGPLASRAILFGSQVTWPDHEFRVGATYLEGIRTILWDEMEFPVYEGALAFPEAAEPLAWDKETGQPVGFFVQRGNARIFRLGYDLFREVFRLLLEGQPISFSATPTLEIHIDLLRSLLLGMGVPILELPPRPSGADFIACLTHDVDFLGIKDHGLDRSVIGFALRVLAMQGTRDLRGRVSPGLALKNWKALFSLPAVHLGICKDFWLDVMRYRELERGKPSTFFFLPFKGKPGDRWNGRPPSQMRKAKYDLDSYQWLLKDLLSSGSEVALHGIDAWADEELGRRELERIKSYSDEVRTGVRMHWLYFDKDTPSHLEKASFSYDSSRGYNEAVGFLCGTSQVFRLWGTKALLELPLNVMDTALFYRSRMGLKGPQAMKKVEAILESVKRYGGVFTLNWHTRSLSPERNWEEFYTSLLALLESNGAVFLSASEAVQWFAARRNMIFGEVRLEGSSMKVKVEGEWPSNLPKPRIILRIPAGAASPGPKSAKESDVLEPRWLGERELEFTW